MIQRIVSGGAPRASRRARIVASRAAISDLLSAVPRA